MLHFSSVVFLHNIIFKKNQIVKIENCLQQVFGKFLPYLYVTLKQNSRPKKFDHLKIKVYKKTIFIHQIKLCIYSFIYVTGGWSGGGYLNMKVVHVYMCRRGFKTEGAAPY